MTKSKSRKTYVYAIGREEGPVKIGYASNPRRRMWQIQCGCPFKVSLLHSVEVETSRVAKHHEQIIQGSYEDQYLRGEWFSFPGSIAREAIDCSVVTLEAFQ